MKINWNWIIVALLICIFGILTALHYVNQVKQNQEYFNYNGVSLSYKDYQAIKEEFADYLDVKICKLKTGDCILLRNLENYKKINS